MIATTNQEIQYAPWLAPKMFNPTLNLCITLSELILFLSNDFRLYEQECEQRSDHVVKCADGGYDIVVFDVSIGSNRELTVSHVHFWWIGD